MLKFTITSIFQSYGEVVLDKLSNNIFETFLDLDILESTFTNALFTAAISIIEEKIIDILKENLEKFETNKNEISDLDDSKSQDIESAGIIEQEELENSSISSDSNDETKLLDVETERVSYKSLLLTLPLFLSSTLLVWLNESVDNGIDINFKTLSTALPLLTLYNLDSVFFSLVNCIVNGDELPFISLFKKCNKSNEIAVVVDNSITNIEDLREVVIQVDQRQIIPINIKEINEEYDNEKKYSSWPNLSTDNSKSKEEIRIRSLTF
ncbi:hypothetical protein [Spiroplasma endosymbiont of Nebria brevicollis]|uniref:hypothetical protein n=1 Tax=Spiroplasma endosymbiont of Nebria brevicollis TaxID=3066284 RepID=UPI00313EA982